MDKRLFQTIKSLSLNMTWKMMRALLSKPFLLIPTIWATIESVWLAEVKFQGNSTGNDIANAFRHAAWNLLIAKNCSVLTSSEKAVAWAKFTTDLHEECFVNDEFDQKMDLHNNGIGRKLFLKMIENDNYSKKKMMAELLLKCESAIGLTNAIGFENHAEELVYFKALN